MRREADQAGRKPEIADGAEDLARAHISPSAFDRLRRATPARLGVGHAGPRSPTAALLSFRADHARAVDAVRNELSAAWASRHGMMEVCSRAESRETYLLRPELGRRLKAADAARLKSLRPKLTSGVPTVMICVGDGLSCAAVEEHAPGLVRAVRQNLRGRYRILKPPIFVRNARVRIQDHLGEIVRPDLIVMIVGERPGLASAASLSAYVLWQPRLNSREPDRTVISNIHPGGLPTPQAGRKIAQLVADAVANRASGAALAATLASQRS
ncbi:MAG TPA: ethanolamine ammonia-lyase subunit EutC [Candidatus Binataceae bacterium]|nr:ethanolamine ammonia-lyase subunit EutC [Candidatus Binataceae bacterium]